MYTGLQHLHSGLAYLLLAILIFAFIYALINYTKEKPFTDKVRKTALAGLIATHLQLLVGLILYFISPVGISNFSGEAMADTMSRLYVMEHPLTMLIAVILITVGYSKSKSGFDEAKRYKQLLIFYGLGLFLILLRIPWSVWP